MRISKRSFRYKPRIGIHDYFNKRGDTISQIEYYRKFHVERYRRVAETILPDGTEISTVSLMLNHQFKDRAIPIIFETMVFSENKSVDGLMLRYHTLAEARKGHYKMIVKCKSRKNNRKK